MSSTTEKLMRLTKKELVKMIMGYEDGYGGVQSAVEELMKENEKLRLEAEKDSLEYNELLKYKNQMMKKYRKSIEANNKLEEVNLEYVNDLGGNVIKLN